MKISKHIHSCLLVEDKEQTILIDPGIFSYQEKALDLTHLTKLDYILISHRHPDHFYPLFIQELVTKFPQVKIISNQEVVDELQNATIKAVTTGNEFIQIEPLVHEKLWDTEPPANTSFTLFNKITHPGDSYHFTSTSEVLALPLQAPWGSTTAAIEKALSLKPKVIIPIHDWHWKDVVRKGMYERLEKFFEPLGVQFKKMETGEIVEV